MCLADSVIPHTLFSSRRFEAVSRVYLQLGRDPLLNTTGSSSLLATQALHVPAGRRVYCVDVRAPLGACARACCDALCCCCATPPTFARVWPGTGCAVTFLLTKNLALVDPPEPVPEPQAEQERASSPEGKASEPSDATNESKLDEPPRMPSPSSRAPSPAPRATTPAPPRASTPGPTPTPVPAATPAPGAAAATATATSASESPDLSAIPDATPPAPVEVATYSPAGLPRADVVQGEQGVGFIPALIKEKCGGFVTEVCVFMVGWLVGWVPSMFAVW